MHTIAGELASAAAFLKEAAVDSPRVDAELILAAVLAMKRESLLAHDRDELNEADRLKFNRWIARRGDKREPVAYITGTCEFYGLQFKVSPSVLIPRPETEILVERALAIIGSRPLRVADVGTGSGAIAVSIALNSPAIVVATDLSPRALAIANQNGRGRIELRDGDLFAPLAGERFDLICSNPPYVAQRDAGTLAPELKHEPAGALFGGEDGFEILRRIAREAPPAILLVEIGAGQATEARNLFHRGGWSDVVFHRDLAGIDRVLEGRKP